VPVAEETPDTASPVVLIIEDEVLIRMGLADYLRGRGYEVLEASDAARAFALLAKPIRIDVVVTDVIVPGPMSGYDVARWLRKNRPELPVIVATGVEGERSSGDGGRDRPDILKPYIYRDVENRVRIALGGRGSSGSRLVRPMGCPMRHPRHRPLGAGG
jgi:CheY-like chemotaxis protein